MQKKIEIKGKGADNLSVEYFEHLLKDEYGIRGDFTIEYERGSENNTGTVTITGEGLDISTIYTALSRNFTLTEIKNGTSLEDKLKGDN